MNILKRIQGIIDYDTCDMQEDERDALRADLSCIYKAVQQQAEQIAALSNRHQCLSDVANGYVAEIKRLKDIIASIFGGQNNET